MAKTIEELENMESVASEKALQPNLHGMTYEEGVLNAVRWMLGQIEDEDLF